MTVQAESYRTISLTQRPFLGVEGFERSVASVEVTINGTTHSEDAVFIESSRWLSDPNIKVSFKLDEAALEQALESSQLEAEDLLFVVALRGVLLKETRTLRTEQLSHLDGYDGVLEFSIDASEYPLITQDSFAGFQIVHAIVLGRELPPHDLRPSRIGTWLHRGVVSVKPMRSNTKFRTEAMSVEDKQGFRIPPTAVTYVSISESIASAEDLDSAATLYIDEQLYSYLNDQGESLAGQQFMMSIVIDFFMTLIAHAVQRLSQGAPESAAGGVADIESTSVMYSIMEQLAEASGVSVEFLIDQVVSNPQMLRSYLEAYYDDLDGMLNMLKHERLA